MQRKAQTSDFDLQAFLRGVGNATKGEVSDALDGDSGSNSYDGEDEEGR